MMIFFITPLNNHYANQYIVVVMIFFITYATIRELVERITR
jgi:hypothetical protein